VESVGDNRLLAEKPLARFGVLDFGLRFRPTFVWILFGLLSILNFASQNFRAWHREDLIYKICEGLKFGRAGFLSHDSMVSTERSPYA
jgi:hypothetical protein